MSRSIAASYLGLCCLSVAFIGRQSPSSSWLNRWPTDLVDSGRVLFEMQIFLNKNNVQGHTVFHYRPNIVLIRLKYC